MSETWCFYPPSKNLHPSLMQPWIQGLTIVVYCHLQSIITVSKLWTDSLLGPKTMWGTKHLCEKSVNAACSPRAGSHLRWKPRAEPPFTHFTQTLSRIRHEMFFIIFIFSLMLACCTLHQKIMLHLWRDANNAAFGKCFTSRPGSLLTIVYVWVKCFPAADGLRVSVVQGWAGWQFSSPSLNNKQI